MAFASLVVKISGEFTSLDAALKKSIERVKSFGSNLQGLGSALAIGISAPLAGVSAIALKSAGDLEALKLGLTAVAGSARAAEVQFTQLREVAKLPGLGLQEAVQGSIRLQAVGFSAEKAKNLLLQFGNAVATVGGTRSDLEEVTRQLAQLGARGSVTADNLKPIIERVPQLAGIIKRNFGAEALGNPAETFKKLGISSQEFITIIEAELGKLPRVTGGLKNDFENLRDSITIAFGEAGSALAPFAKQFIDGFAIPAIEKLKGLAEGFKTLSPNVQTAVVGFGGIVTVAPLVLAGLGSMLTNIGLLTQAVASLGGALGVATLAAKGFVIALGAGAIVATIDAFMGSAEAAKGATKANEDFEKSLSKTIIQLRQQGVTVSQSLVEDWNKGRISSEEFARSLRALAVEHGKTVKPTKAQADGINELGEKAAKATKHIRDMKFVLAEQTTESQVLAKMMAILNQGHDELIERIARARLGLINMWDGLPQFEVATVQVKRLGEELSFVKEAAADTAFALNQISTTGLDRVQNQQRAKKGTDEFGAVVKAGAEGLRDSAKAAKQYSQQVSLITNDLARGISKLIIEGGKLKDVMTSAFKEIGQSLLRLALEKQFQRIAVAIQDLVIKHIPSLGKALGSIFGSAGSSAAGSAAGGVAGAASGVAGGAASAAGSVAGGAGKAAAGAASGLAGTITAVAGVGQLISSVIGNFQFAAMNKSLDLIEHEVRFSQIHLLHTLEGQNKWLPFLSLIHDRLLTVVGQGIGVFNALGDGGLRIAGAATGGGATYNFDLRGASLGGSAQGDIEAMFRVAADKILRAGA